MSKSSDVPVIDGNKLTDQVKDLIYSRLEDYGVEDARENVLLHHYRRGDFVAVRNDGVSDIGAFNRAYSALVNDYWSNRDVNDNTFWVSRDWIRRQL